jgi:hypothetical protein
MSSEGNFTGPWDCTRQDRRLIFGGWEGFCAAYEDGLWGLYFDVDGDHLKSKLGEDTYVILDIDLVRRELRTARPQAATEAEAAAAKAAAAEQEAQPSATAEKSMPEEKSQPSETAEEDNAPPSNQESEECQLDGVIEEYEPDRDDDARSESAFSGVTYTGDERIAESGVARVVDDGIRVFPSPSENSGNRGSDLYAESRSDSDRGWTSSVYSEDSRPRYSRQPSEAEVDELREEVD